MGSNMDREVEETTLQTSFCRLSIWTSTSRSLICASGTGGECGRRQGVMKLCCYLISFTFYLGSGDEVLPPATGYQEQCYWKYPDVRNIRTEQHWPQYKPGQLGCQSQTVDPLPDVVCSTRSTLSLFLLTNEGWNNYCMTFAFRHGSLYLTSLN